MKQRVKALLVVALILTGHIVWLATDSFAGKNGARQATGQSNNCPYYQESTGSHHQYRRGCDASNVKGNNVGTPQNPRGMGNQNAYPSTPNNMN